MRPEWQRARPCQHGSQCGREQGSRRRSIRLRPRRQPRAVLYLRLGLLKPRHDVLNAHAVRSSAFCGALVRRHECPPRAWRCLPKETVTTRLCPGADNGPRQLGRRTRVFVNVRNADDERESIEPPPRRAPAPACVRSGTGYRTRARTRARCASLWRVTAAQTAWRTPPGVMLFVATSQTSKLVYHGSSARPNCAATAAVTVRATSSSGVTTPVSLASDVTS